jgi:hypothetical protein
LEAAAFRHVFEFSGTADFGRLPPFTTPALDAALPFVLHCSHCRSRCLMPIDDMMTKDRELWACAAHVLGKHGEEAIAFVADRVAALARAGDGAGIRTWRMIAERIDALCDGATAEQARH